MHDSALREALLRRLIPKKAPLAQDVDLGALAKRFELSGGSWVNVVRQAMRYTLRRKRGRKIRMADLMKAAEAEQVKGTTMAKDHLGTWAVNKRQRLGGYG